MLRAMNRSAVTSALLVLAVASLGGSTLACSKEKKDEGEATADAAPSATAVAEADAAPPVAEVADAGDTSDASDEAAAPLASVVAPKPVPKPDPPICVTARAAKKKGSPAAPTLEAQCKAAGGKL
jgi:hypothetical protein